MDRSRDWTADVLAGISVALVVIPQSMAYAELAGLPAYRGLYAGALPPLVAAMFASSRYLQTGPTAMTSLLAYGALSSAATPGTNEYVGLAALLAVVVGVTRLAFGVIGAGNISYLLSRAVLRSFTLAAAVIIAASQVPAVLGVSPSRHGVWNRAVDSLTATGAWSGVALALAVLTVASVYLGRRIHALFPGVLVAVIAGIIYSHVGGYAGPQIGPVPTSILPPLQFDLPWSGAVSMIVPGVIIALVGFAEIASVSQVYAEREKQLWHPNREFISQGVANLAAGFVGAFPVGGSFSRSSVNYVAGAKTRMAGAVTGATVLLLLPFAGVLSPLPQAVLGGIVVAAVIKLLDPRPFIELWRISLPQALIGSLTFVLTLVLAPHVEYAVIAGIGVSVLVHIWREQYVRVDVDVDGATLILRPKGVIWFASAPTFRNAMAATLAMYPNIDRLEIELSGIGRVDLNGAIGLRELATHATESGLIVAFGKVPPNAERILSRVCTDYYPHNGQVAPGDTDAHVER